MLQIMRMSILLITVATTFVGVILEQEMVLFVSLLLMLTHNAMYGLEAFQKRLLFTFFHATFFIFLVSRMSVVILFDYRADERGIFGTNFYASWVVNEMLLMMIVALAGLFLGTMIAERKLKPTFSTNVVNNTTLIISITTVMVVSFALRMVYWMESIIAARNLGYFAYFANFETALPKPIELIGEMFPVAFFMYLAMMPTGKKLYIPIAMYLFEGTFAMMTGSRQAFMLNILIIVIYILFRRLISTKKIIGGLAVSLPAIIILLNVIEQMRNKYATETSSIFESVLEFFYAQGVSSNVLGYTVSLSDEIPDKIYTIGPLIEFLMFNIIGPITGTMKELKGQTVERALEGYQYSHTISYLIMPDLYERGVGYGSSFIAEWYHDLGMFGVIIGSFLVGVLMVIFTKMFSAKSVLTVTVALLMMRMTLFIPRASSIAFIIDTFSPVNILGVGLILSLYVVLRHFESQEYRIEGALK